jgi:hypothetical protein
MKTIKLLSFFLMIFLFSYKIHAQEVVLYEGSPDFLKGQTNLNVEFVYTGMMVSDLTEDIYLKQKRKEFRKAADGDKFVKKWNSDRADVYEQKFVDQLNKSLKKINIVAEKNKPAYKYTMIVQTVKLEPGYYNGSNGNKRDTYVNLLTTFVESSNRDNVLCTLKADKIVGTTDEQMQMMETTLKITNAYANAAEKTGKMIVKICTQKEKKKDVSDDEIKHDKKDKKDKKDRPKDDETE